MTLLVVLLFSAYAIGRQPEYRQRSAYTPVASLTRYTLDDFARSMH